MLTLGIMKQTSCSSRTTLTRENGKCFITSVFAVTRGWSGVNITSPFLVSTIEAGGGLMGAEYFLGALCIDSVPQRHHTVPEIGADYVHPFIITL